MKRIIIIVSLFCFVQTGCEKSESEFVVSPANEFKIIFLKELRSITKIDSDGSSVGWSEVYISNELFTILDEEYDHSKTYELGLAAYHKWKTLTNIRVNSTGGGENQFYMSFSKKSQFAFIDVLSYKFLDKNIIDIRIRAVVSIEEGLNFEK